MVRTIGLHQALGKVIGRSLGAKVSGDADEAPQRRRPTTSARRQQTTAPVVEDVENADHRVDEIVLEFYANAWPTEEGVRDMRSWVRGQWIPFDANALSQFLGDPLVLEEGQECEFSQRRNRADGFDEEAISQLLCTPGQDFARIAARRRVRIMAHQHDHLDTDVDDIAT